MVSIEKQFTNFMDLKMTVNEIEEKLFNYVEYQVYLNSGRAFRIHHDLGTVLENSEGVYLIGSSYLDDISKNAELHEFLHFFKYAKVLHIDLGDDTIGYIYKLHGFKDDIR